MPSILNRIMISSTWCIPLDVQDLCLCADKFGTGFTLIRSDIGGNIDRLAAAYGHNSDRYRKIFSIILDEVQRGEQEGKQSETNALLWLKRWVTSPSERSYVTWRMSLCCYSAALRAMPCSVRSA